MKNIIVIMLLAFAGSSAQAQTPQTGSKHWKLVWQDEFNYTGLPDPAKWGYETGHVRNNEEQYYTLARKENAWVGNGVLTITGRKEEYVNKDYQRGAASWKRKDSLAHYTSASINTLGKAGWKYGKIVIRAKIPHGAGMWPALWMLGVNTPQAGWPAGGEIDIMEAVGNHEGDIYGTIHFADTVHHKHASSGSKTSPAAVDGQFHIYSIEWNAEKIDIFYDNKKYHTFYNDLAEGKGDDNAFRKPFYLLINLAMGGDWPGPVDGSILPKKFEVDYVRVYQ